MLQMFPVLVTFFNRPSTFERVLASIAENDNLEVYFAADGPRNSEDIQNLQECWALVDKYFPKTPLARKFSRSVNRGCREAMIENITWFFESVPYGVILEDDCLPNANFFKEQLTFLEDQGLANKFISVSGSRVIVPGSNYSSFEATQSMFPMVWGWGTWATNWKKYQPDIPDAQEITRRAADKLFPLRGQWLEKELFKNTFNSRFREVNIGYINTWDYALTATAWRENMMALHLTVNSIVNIGFNSQGTHTVLNAPDWVPQKFEISESPVSSVGDWIPDLDRNIAKLVFNCGVPDFSKNQVKRLLLR